MSKRNLQQQYEYETLDRGLSHKDALDQMKWMFTPEQLATLVEIKECNNCGNNITGSKYAICDECG